MLQLCFSLFSPGANQPRVYLDGMSTPSDGMATIFRSSDHTAEIEAEMIMGMLESNGVKALLKGLDVLPGAHDVEIMVPAEQQQLAEQLIAEAKQAGPAAAEEAEQATEKPDARQ
jgi:hypothetical protein